MPSTKSESHVFVTVGTTQFNTLVSAVASKVALDWMVSCGFTSLTIQYGKGQPPSFDHNDWPIEVRAYDFAPSLEEDMHRADLIISHAGAGTIMEALRLEKLLVVVINTSLMNNHQLELAGAMAERGHLFMVKEPKELYDAITWESFKNFSRVPHKGGDHHAFPRLLDLHLGFQQNKQD
jgi:beta-1,4-N-acetylglucosaminyltransferase